MRVLLQNGRPKAAMPASVQIGPFSYTVEGKKPRRDEHVGSITYRKGEIRLRPGMPISRTRETLLHEVCHGLIQLVGHEFALEEKGDECEAFVKAFAPALLDTMRRNPALV